MIESDIVLFLSEDEKRGLLKTKPFIFNAQKILIVGHSRPDGDTLGAMLALYWSLKKIGKKVTPFCIDKPGFVYEFLPGVNEIKNEINFNQEKFDLVIFVDCATEKMTGIYDDGFPFKKETFMINIDHHPSNSLFGNLNIVSENSAATSEIIFFLLKLLDIEITKEIATCLLCGIYTDTGSFQHQNTTKRVLQVAAFLLKIGGNIKEITKYTFKTKKLSTLYLWGRAMSSLLKNEKYNIVTAIITQDDLKETGASEEEVEGIANFLNNISGIRAILVLTEKNNGFIKGSLRSKDPNFDVLPLARLLGGGGHKKAAGFMIKGKLKKNGEKWQVID